MKCEAEHYEDAPCSEDVSPVNVKMPGGHDWGTFWYCSVAIEEDRKRGFVVTPMTLDEAAAADEAYRG